MLLLVAKTSLHHIFNWAKHVNYATSTMIRKQVVPKLWPEASYMKYLLMIHVSFKVPLIPDGQKCLNYAFSEFCYNMTFKIQQKLVFFSILELPFMPNMLIPRVRKQPITKDRSTLLAERKLGPYRWQFLSVCPTVCHCSL